MVAVLAAVLSSAGNERESSPTAHVADAEIQRVVDGKPRSTRTKIAFLGQQVWIDARPFTGHASDVLYSATRDVIWFVDHHDRTYMELDPKVVSGVGRALQSTVDSVRGLISGEAVDQRPPMGVSATQDVGARSGLPCQRFVVSEGKTHMQDVWVTSWRRAGVDSKTFGVVRDFAKAFEKIRVGLRAAPVLSGMADIPLTGIARVDGYPMDILQYRGEKIVYRVRLGPPESATVPAARFRVPEGYAKQWL